MVLLQLKIILILLQLRISICSKLYVPDTLRRLLDIFLVTLHIRSREHWEYTGFDLKQIVSTILEVIREIRSPIQLSLSNSRAHFLIIRPCYFFCRTEEEYQEGLNPWDSGSVGDSREIMSCGKDEKKEREETRHRYVEV